VHEKETGFDIVLVPDAVDHDADLDHAPSQRAAVKEPRAKALATAGTPHRASRDHMVT
jgi:hypothetical protein